MSDTCQQYIRWMIQGGLRAAFQYLSQVQDQELFRALAVPAIGEIEDLYDAEPEGPPGFAPDIPGVGPSLSPAASAILGAASMGGQVLSRMPQMIYAFHVVQKRKLRFAKGTAAPNPASDIWAKDYIHHCVSHAGIPLNLDEDLTDSLPAPLANPPTLTEADFTAAATTLGVDVPAVKAVSRVESAGAGFGDDGRPIIRYELHRFQDKTKSHFHKTHPHLSQPNLAAGGPYHNGTQDSEYSLLYNAMLLEDKGVRMIEKAIESASWGKFQVMGENWSSMGWGSALKFASDMYLSEANHLTAFVKFVQAKGLTTALKKHHWKSFAAGYNGSNYAVNNYDTNLERAFNHFNRAQAPAHP